MSKNIKLNPRCHSDGEYIKAIFFEQVKKFSVGVSA